MKTVVTALLVTVVLLVCGPVLASEVTNVELSSQDGFTVARIDVNGPIRFTHQTEEAKDGRPYRVIVDILAADHKLGAQTFTLLPACPVKSIRTSQYSVTPERVVRIVFDMDTERIYRIDSDSKRVSVFFTDDVKRNFAPWSTASTIAKGSSGTSSPSRETPKVAATPEPKKSAPELNSAINSDRMASLQPSSSQKETGKTAAQRDVSSHPSTPPKSAAVTNSSKPNSPAVKSTPPSGAVSSTKQPYGPTVDAKQLAQDAGNVASGPETKPIQIAQSDPSVTKPKVKTEGSLNAKQAVQPKEKAEAEVKPNVKKSEEPSSEAPDQPAAKMQKQQKVEPSTTSTSRFRRSPVDSRKVKGTMVAEFPKRLVIKYKSKLYRDPFMTLINEAKVDNSLIEQKVANVEDLKLVGIIEGSEGSNRALFEDSEGYGYMLKTGDKVQKGYVFRVERDRVYFQIFEYGWSRTVALNLES